MKIEPLHQEILNWFVKNEAKTTKLPKEVEFENGSSFLQTQARGIFKPKWSNYIISIKTVLNSPYNDKIEVSDDGSWSIKYHKDDSVNWTNQALEKNMKEDIPVGLFYQTSKQPSLYKNYGLGRINKFEDNYFFISSINNSITLDQKTLLSKDIFVSKFESKFERFKEYMNTKSGIEFKSFSHPYIVEREEYKKKIRENGLSQLKLESWNSEMIGSGKIITLVINSIEIKNNNLCNWTARFGSKSKVHYKLILAKEKGDNLKEIEQTLFSLYHNIESEKVIFDKLKQLVGKKYSLLAYLFYLKNDKKYVPISTTAFDNAFNKLGSEFKTSLNASWENYINYLNKIKEVKRLIEEEIGHEIQLIDAHSFLWIVGRNELSNTEFNNVIEIKASLIQTKSKSKVTTRNYGTVISNMKGVDWLEIEKSKHINGRKAEEIVLIHEKEELLKNGKKELASKVSLDPSELGGIGYDILSFHKDGKEKHIEVKSSKSNRFIISRNEFEVSKKDPYYFIYIVRLGKDNKHEIDMIESPVFENTTEFTVEPRDFNITFDPR